jgi:hypothetical protein
MPTNQEKIDRINKCIRVSKEYDGRRLQSESLLSLCGYNKNTSVHHTYIWYFIKNEYIRGRGFLGKLIREICYSQVLTSYDFLDFIAPKLDVQTKRSFIMKKTFRFRGETFYVVKNDMIPFYILKENGGWVSDEFPGKLYD